ncbi:MAG: HD domain-containing phosphohydrolase [Erysipelotrichaceae bacterium]
MEIVKFYNKINPLTTYDSGIYKLELIDQIKGTEFMYQTIVENSLGYIYAGDDTNLFEFFCVISGKIQLTYQNEEITLIPGDTFSVTGLSTNIPFKALETTQLLYITNGKVFDDLSIFYSQLEGMLQRIQEKDLYTHEHCKNVVKYCDKIATQLNLSSDSYDKLMLAALFHDVGKAHIPDEILLKRDRLDRYEYDIMKTHVIHSHTILAETYGEEIASIAAKHHERLDGSGYPHGLHGDDIPMESRILTVADAYDAMVSTRPYKTPMSQSYAFSQLKALVGVQFDEQVVQALIRALTQKEQEFES